VGATLAKKSSYNREQCCFGSRPHRATRFSYLALRLLLHRLNQNLFVKVATRKPSYNLSHIASKRVHEPRRMNQVASESDRKSAMHLTNVVAASLLATPKRREGGCRGGLALLPTQIRRHTAVATTLRVHSLIRLSTC